MAKLILTLDGSYLNEYSLSRAHTSIGRKSSNDIHLDNLSISGSHAMVIKQGQAFFIEDLNSTNGTRLNNTAITKHLLQNDDVIELGRYSLTFVDGAASQDSSAFEKTMMMHPSEFNHQPHSGLASGRAINVAPIAGAPNVPNSIATPNSTSAPSFNSPSVQSNHAAHTQPALIGKIQVLNGTSSGRELVLSKALTTLGKVGVQVAVITKRPEGYFITHVEGKVLPMINGVSAGVQARALADHDVIELAGVKMEFYLSNS